MATTVKPSQLPNRLPGTLVSGPLVAEQGVYGELVGTVVRGATSGASEPAITASTTLNRGHNGMTLQVAATASTPIVTLGADCMVPGFKVRLETTGAHTQGLEVRTHSTSATFCGSAWIFLDGATPKRTEMLAPNLSSEYRLVLTNVIQTPTVIEIECIDSPTSTNWAYTVDARVNETGATKAATFAS